jgi:hypothetical protein
VFDGWLQYGDVEIMNIARTSEYVRKLIPTFEVRCSPGDLRIALEHDPYVDPVTDSAPWYRADRPATGRFLGIFPGVIDGADKGTREVSTTQLASDGAIHSLARYGSKEIRVTGMALALDEEAMQEGMAWLRDRLDGSDCIDNHAGLSCTGMDLFMFNSTPGTLDLLRTFYSCELIEGPLPVLKRRSKPGAKFPWVAWKIEFTFDAGSPFAYTPLERVGTIDMNTATSWTDPADEDCSQQNIAYEDFINDPYFTAVVPPPRPPVITPPNIIDLESWRRQSTVFTPAMTARWGRLVPSINIETQTDALQQMRIRFYNADVEPAGCDYEGEFLFSYLPPFSKMTIDGIRRSALVTLQDGRTVPGGHLLYGSDGRPFLWPTLGCHESYRMVVDMMPGITGVWMSIDAAVRE